MGHPRWPGFDHRTGNPVVDNRTRQLNLRIWRDTKARFRVTTSGRKRKKLLKRVEGGNYIKIIAAVMNDLSAERHALEGYPEGNKNA